MPAAPRNRRRPLPWCDLDAVTNEILRDFLARSNFARAGAVITDLDGTALHLANGQVTIAKPVELGLKRLYDLGRPFVINSLRSPLSVLRSFGRDWYSVANAPTPAITLNGSLLGYVTQNAAGEITFEEIASFPLLPADIDAALDTVAKLTRDGVHDFLLFYYPRQWQAGEILWTPAAERIPALLQRYRSASGVVAWEPPHLRERLHAEDISMIHLLLDLPPDQLKAYQHTRRDNFLTCTGIDKLSGARQIASLLHFDLASSIGAGDTDMDRFLSGVGLAVVVGDLPVPFQGLFSTLRLKDSFELGDLLFEVVALLQ
jgi:hydroxymethylpyrimidine pyrophosphatase-like HAD family hydrolase